MKIIMDEKPAMLPPLDEDFRPAALFNRGYIHGAGGSGNGVPLIISLERSDGLTSVYTTVVYEKGCGFDNESRFYAERLIKTLLWIRGGWRITVGGPGYIGEYIRDAYKPGGIREFDAGFMSRVYEKPFTVVVTDADKINEPKGMALNVPPDKNGDRGIDASRSIHSRSLHLSGCRIGFDAGGSDRKVSAVADGKVVYSEEVIWHPKLNSDPLYHYNEILAAMKTAAAHMPRVDAIGVSSAGIYINNRTMAASLFIKVPEELFEKYVKDIYPRVCKQFGDVPLKVANDGDVTALAGAMTLNDTNVLGIAMGTSEAAGYIDSAGNITGWLNELAFVPVDYNIRSMKDEWSGDYGCGVKYFSQDGVIKLAAAAGIKLDEKATPAEKLKYIQGLLENGNSGAEAVFVSIGRYLGYSLAHYSDFFDIKHLLLLGRVTSGKGGDIIVKEAGKVLEGEFPELFGKIVIHLPDESDRRIGQSVAAASLPEL